MKSKSGSREDTRTEFGSASKYIRQNSLNEKGPPQPPPISEL